MRAHPHLSGFTLIELLVVVIIIAVISSIAVPQFIDTQSDIKITAARVTVKGVQQQIERYRIKHGSWPNEIDSNWFRGRDYPQSPFSPGYVGDTVNINDSPTKFHPGYKTLEKYQPFWYCRGNGSFRIRVPTQSTPIKTLELYNAANDSNDTALSF